MNVNIMKPKDGVRLRLDLKILLFLFMLGIIFSVRISNLNYNTLFVDEAANLLAGHDAFVGRFDRNITSWFGGSYLYPLIATFADSLAGVWGARLVSALLTTATAVFVFLTAKRLFGRPAALWAMAIFGLTGASISLGQMAVYDVLCLPFLALAFYFLVEAVHSEGRLERNYLLAAALSFIVGTLGKYTGIFYLPALTLIAVALYGAQSRWRCILRFTGYFFLPVVLILGAYVLFYFKDLMLVFTTQGFQAADRWEVIQVIWDEIGSAIVLAVIGSTSLLLTASQSGHANSLLAVQIIAAFLRSRRRFVLALAILMVVILVILIPAFLALPLYQLATANIRSVWKNTISSLIFLAPLAGYAVATIIQHVRSLSLRLGNRVRFLSAFLTIVGLLLFANYALDRNWGFQNSWPNVTGAVNYVQSHGFGEDSKILVEGGSAFEYYFGVGREARGNWADTWYMSYNGLQGVDAMIAAIRDRQLDFVVLDNHHTPEVTPQLVAALTEAGYNVGYEDLQILSVGSRRVLVYVKEPIK